MIATGWNGCSIERSDDEDAPRARETPDGLKEPTHIGNMLHDFQGEHDVEGRFRLRAKVFRQRMPVLDGHARLSGMVPRDHHVTLGCIDPDNLGSEPGHGLGDEPRTASGIEQPQPLQRPLPNGTSPGERRELLRQVGYPGRIEFVHDLEGPARLPPLLRKCVEARDLGRVGSRLHALSFILAQHASGLRCCFRLLYG